MVFTNLRKSSIFCAISCPISLYPHYFSEIIGYSTQVAKMLCISGDDIFIWSSNCVECLFQIWCPRPTKQLKLLYDIILAAEVVIPE
jgi:hypothetical protein